MSIEVTKLELIKLKYFLKKYKKYNNLNFSNIRSYSPVDISYSTINRFINEDVFCLLIKLWHNIEQITPFKSIIDSIDYNTLNYNEIDNNIRLMLEKIDGVETFKIIYEILNDIDIVPCDDPFIKSDLTNWESIRKVLKFYKRDIKEYYSILNNLMIYNRIRINTSEFCENNNFYESITNTYFLRINDNNSLLKNIILSREFMHIVLSNKKEKLILNEAKPIMAEKLYIKSLINDNSCIYNRLYFYRINDTFNRVYILKSIYEFLTSYDIENTCITKENIDNYRINNNISISQILSILKNINYDQIIESLEYIFSDIVSNIMFQNYNGIMSDIEKYPIYDDNIKSILLKIKKANYIEEYNSFIKSIK